MSLLSNWKAKYKINQTNENRYFETIWNSFAGLFPSGVRTRFPSLLDYLPVVGVPAMVAKMESLDPFYRGARRNVHFD